jgi:uncharacterized membrane protein
MGMEIVKAQPGESRAQRIGRWMLGGTMVFAGISHLTFARRAFRAQVPKFVPKLSGLSVDQVVVWSGVVEIAMGLSLILLPKQRRAVGWALGTMFVAIFPGNLAQWYHNRDAFGLDTDGKRLARLFGQPVLVGWTLWSTGALRMQQQRHLIDGDGGEN